MQKMDLSAMRKMLTTTADIRRVMLVQGVTITGAHVTIRKIPTENVKIPIENVGETCRAPFSYVFTLEFAEARRNRSFNPCFNVGFDYSLIWWSKSSALTALPD